MSRSASQPPAALPGFPGGTSVSHLCVYDWDAADGFHGGTPHLHTLSTEAYVVVAGRGEVHTISAAGPARDDLAPGSLLWFTPGTVHRLVNHGGLELAVVMSNAGLPEAGDAVMTFPDEIVSDPTAYREAAALSADAGEAAKAAAARARRDLALQGYHQLLEAVEAEGAPVALGRFYEHAVRLVQPLTDRWQEIFEANVAAETQRVQAQLEALKTGAQAHLHQAAVIRGEPKAGPRLYGMCGRLQTWRG